LLHNCVKVHEVIELPFGWWAGLAEGRVY